METAKCMLTKEQIDKQKTGQPSVSPFLKVNQQNPKKTKSISFSTMETIQKQGDSIDMLTSLKNELSSKLDRKDNSAKYKQEYIREELEDEDKDGIDMALEIDLIVEKEFHIIIAETEGIIRMTIIMVIEAIDLEMGNTKQIIGIVIGLSIEGKVLTKIIVKDIETEV